MSWRDRQRRFWIAIGLAYGLVAVVTFGHAAAAGDRASAADLARCRANRNNVCVPDPVQGPLGGLLAAALWSLYWSWEAQS